MAATCASCGVKLSLGRRIAGHRLCEACEAREAAQQAAQAAAYAGALTAYRQAAQQVPTARDAIAPQIHQLAVQLRPQDLAAVNVEVFRQVVNAAIQDDFLSDDEEAAMDSTIRILGIDDATKLSVVRPVADRFRIARLNAGRFKSVPTPSIFLKPNETDFLEVSAQLLKEVVHRQTQGGYSGVSFRIAKGVRYNVGGYPWQVGRGGYLDRVLGQRRSVRDVVARGVQGSAPDGGVPVRQAGRAQHL